MDFGSFENSIDKNIETDKASDKFDQQLQATRMLATVCLRQKVALKWLLLPCMKQKTN